MGDKKEYLFFGLLLAFVCARAIAAESISGAELVERLQTDAPPLILDVRTPREFDTGHIPGAVNIPVSDLAGRLGELMPYKDKEIVVHCQAGPRAGFATKVLEQNGFTGIRDLQGHMNQWVSSGYPLATSQ